METTSLQQSPHPPTVDDIVGKRIGIRHHHPIIIREVTSQSSDDYDNRQSWPRLTEKNVNTTRVRFGSTQATHPMVLDKPHILEVTCDIDAVADDTTL